MPKPSQNKSPEPEFVSVSEAAAQVGVTPEAVHNWINKGYLRARRKGFGKSSPFLIYRASWEKFLRDREVNTELDDE